MIPFRNRVTSLFAFAALVTSCAISRGADWVPVPPPAAPSLPSKVLLPASRDFNTSAGLPVRVLFDNPVRDPHILHAPDGYFYMVATASKNTLPASIPARSDSDFWTWNDGIPLWRSKDLVGWETAGYVWQFERDATWNRAAKPSPHTGDGKPVRAIWAPEIHFFKNTFWMTYSMNYDGTGLLKSTSGKPEGPYVEMKPSGPISDGIDATVFEDKDGSVYWLDFGYRIAKMKSDLSDIAQPMHDLNFSPAPPWGEGINMKRVNGKKYLWTNAGRESGSYDAYSATSDSVEGPYLNRYRAIPFAGHNNLFQDDDGNFWSTLFHPNDYLNLGFRPAVVPISMTKDALIAPKRSYARPTWKFSSVSPTGNWTAKSYNDKGWVSGQAGFGDPKIKETGPITDVATIWKSGDLWLRRTFKTEVETQNPLLFLRSGGPIEVSLNGTRVYSGTNALKDYRTEMLDGVTIPKGENTLAVHVQGGAMPYFDAGLVEARERFLLPTAKEKVALWRMTTDAPANDWMKPDFNDAGWTSAPAGFGNVPDAAGQTPWNKPDIWLRREFSLKNTQFKNPKLRIAYDEDAEVYINGVLAAKLPGFNSQYEDFSLSPQSIAALKVGTNTVAVHCRQTIGAQFIDVGIVDKIG